MCIRDSQTAVVVAACVVVAAAIGLSMWRRQHPAAATDGGE